VPDRALGSEDGTDTAGTLQDTWATDGNGNRTTYAYDSNGDTVAVTSPDGIGAQTATTTAWYNAQGNQACSATAEAASPCSSSQPGPAAVAPARGGAVERGRQVVIRGGSYAARQTTPPRTSGTTRRSMATVPTAASD
jgi:YD repeat-containing protein